MKIGSELFLVSPSLARVNRELGDNICGRHHIVRRPNCDCDLMRLFANVVLVHVLVLMRLMCPLPRLLFSPSYSGVPIESIRL